MRRMSDGAKWNGSSRSLSPTFPRSGYGDSRAAAYDGRDAGSAASISARLSKKRSPTVAQVARTSNSAKSASSAGTAARAPRRAARDRSIVWRSRMPQCCSKSSEMTKAPALMGSRRPSDRAARVLVGLVERVQHRGHAEVRRDATAARVAERPAEPGVACELAERGGERARIPGRDDAPRALERGLHPADVGADDRDPVCHRLEHRERQPLRTRRLHEDVRRGEERRDVLPVAAEADREIAARRRGLERRPLGAVADDEEAVDPGVAAERTEAHVEPLLGRQAPDERRPDVVARDAERRARPLADARDSAGVGDRHAVPHDADAPGRKADVVDEGARLLGADRDEDVRRVPEGALEGELDAARGPAGVLPAGPVRRVQDADPEPARDRAPDHARLAAVEVDDVGAEVAQLGE